MKRKRKKLPAPPARTTEPRHCDDYIDDPTSPAPLRTFLERARMPAHGMLVKEPYPQLFATYKGTRVRVVMASTFGDVGITPNLSAEVGYTARVAVDELQDFSETPL